MIRPIKHHSLTPDMCHHKDCEDWCFPGVGSSVVINQVIRPLVALTVCDFTATWGPTPWPGCLSCLSRVEDTHWGILAVWSTHSRQGRLAWEVVPLAIIFYTMWYWHAAFMDTYWSFNVHLGVIAWPYTIVTERKQTNNQWFCFHSGGI